MTREEITDMTGSVDQTDYAINLLVKHIEKPFLVSVIKAEIEIQKAEIEKLIQDGYIYKENGTYEVAWSKAEKLNGWNLTEDQQKAYDDEWDKCACAVLTLHVYNRTCSLLSVRP